LRNTFTCYGYIMAFKKLRINCHIISFINFIWGAVVVCSYGSWIYQNIFLEKNHTPLQVKWSFPYHLIKIEPIKWTTNLLNMVLHVYPMIRNHKTDRDDITAILLTVALNTITLTLQQAAMFSGSLQQKHVREIGL
jgi:hypothetical protein